MSNRKSRRELRGGPPPLSGSPEARVYWSAGDVRVEATDGTSVIDVAWTEWELMTNAAGVAFTHWVLTHPLEYAAWMDRIGRHNSRRPARRRWPWGR